MAEGGDPYKFSCSGAHIPGLDFSFSGLKTSFLYFIRDQLKENPAFIEENIHDLAASIQYAIVKSLMDKMSKAVKIHNCKHIALSGGVAANTALRDAMTQLAKKQRLELTLPHRSLTTDNAAMIAAYGYFKYLRKDFSNIHAIPYSSKER